ncbi:MAG TPA: cupin domain-containing protein [Casimicrobiaceae bacterium]|jgi:Domain of unknown function (DUF4437)|nr:cupin domain-containing protein [Casimicrobiaceae bacterium]
MRNYGRAGMVAAVALGACGIGVALAAAPMDTETFVSAKDIEWQPAPPSLPPGAKIAVLHGDPGKSGPFVLRLMTPAGYKVAPHWHSQDEALTVISGTLYIGMGDRYEPSTARGLQVGGFHFLPGKAHHYAYSKKPTIVQISGSGPFDINYINRADDPRGGR